MANEKDDEFGKQDQPKEFGQDKQPPTGQQGQRPELGQNQQQPTGQNQGQSSSGQTDPGQSGDTDTLSGEQRGFGQGTGQTGTPSSQSPGGTGGSQGGSGGFVGSPGSGSSDYLQEEGSATQSDVAQSDFAPEGQGALDQDEDIETGQPRGENDIEGGSGV